jgi:hypothetical protein
LFKNEAVPKGRPFFSIRVEIILIISNYGA